MSHLQSQATEPLCQFLQIRNVYTGHRLPLVDVLKNVMDGKHVIFVENALGVWRRRFLVRDNMASWTHLDYSDSGSRCGSDRASCSRLCPRSVRFVR